MCRHCASVPPCLGPTANRSESSSSISTCGRRSTASGHRCGKTAASISSSGTTREMTRVVPDRAGRTSVAVLAPMNLADEEWVGIIETVPGAVVMAPALAIRNTSLLVGLIAVLGAAGLALLIARSLTRPIVQLTAAVQGAAGSRKPVIPVDAGGETGVLARA